MIFSEVEKHLILGHNLVKLKLELQSHEIKGQDYPENTVKEIWKKFRGVYHESFPDFSKTRGKMAANVVPDLFIWTVRKGNQNNPQFDRVEPSLLVALGYNVGLWWQTKSHGGEILILLNRNNQTIIEDLNSIKEGINNRLYSILKSYEQIEFSQEKTFALYREIALAYVRPKSSPPSNIDPVTILFLASNPLESDQLLLGKEAKTIETEIRLANREEQIKVEDEFDVTVDRLSGELIDHQPSILHFSGHGQQTGKIVLLDDNGTSNPIPVESLDALFSIDAIKNKIRLVILNACYSEPTAKAISKHVDCVIGMRKPISDPAAITFSKQLYRGLANGFEVKDSFKLALSIINAKNMNQKDVPKIYWKDNTEKKISFI